MAHAGQFQPGNKLATGDKPFHKALTRAIKQRDPNALRAIADNIIDKAIDGNEWAIAMLADRLDGKAVARAELSGPNGSALFPVTAITVTGVEPSVFVAGQLQRLAEGETADNLALEHDKPA